MKQPGRLWTALAVVMTASWLAAGQRGTPTPDSKPDAGREVREAAYRENNLGVAHLERFDYNAAAAAFAQALKIDAGLAMARLNLAIAQLYDGDLESAAAHALAAVAASPESPQAHYVSGLVSRNANRPADALAAFQRVLEIDPEDAGSRIHLGQIQLADRQYPQASALFEAALAREPFNATAAYGLATALVRSGQREAGEAAMARFETLRDNSAAITYSATYLEQGQ